MWKAVKTVSREKFIAKNVYINKQERYQINNLSLHLKKLEKEQIEPKVRGKKKEIIKIKLEINEIESNNNKKVSVSSLERGTKLTNP